jgi:hypothetical protein
MHPDAKILVVGHSHGGNIALRSICNPSLIKQVYLVCLSTPFLSVRQRYDPKDLITIAMQTGAYMHAILLAFLIGYFSLDARDKEAAIVFFLPGALVGFLLNLLYKRQARKAAKLSEKMEADMRPPSDLPLLILRVTADEASDALSVNHIVGWVIERMIQSVGRLTTKTYETLEKESGYMGQNPFFTFIDRYSFFWTMLAVMTTFIVLAETGSVVAAVGCALFFIGCIVLSALPGLFILAAYVLGFLCVLLMSPIAFFNSVAIGWDFAFAGVLFEVAAEATPLGLWEVILLSPPVQNPEGSLDPWVYHGLMHSAAYQHPSVPIFIAEWLKSTWRVNDGTGSSDSTIGKAHGAASH